MSPSGWYWTAREVLWAWTGAYYAGGPLLVMLENGNTALTCRCPTCGASPRHADVDQCLKVAREAGLAEPHR
jgi:hypothetical protein